MRKQILIAALLMNLGTIGSAHAQTIENPYDLQFPPVSRPAGQPSADDLIDYTFVFPHADRAIEMRSTRAVLDEIVTWLAAEFDLPAVYQHPSITRVSQMKLAALRYRGLGGEWRTHALSAPRQSALLEQLRNTVAVYDDTSRTIYLSETWTGATAAELSVLVHEMVHHLQNLAGLKYECAHAREKPAYFAQDQWLARFGQSLEEEFEVDLFTIIGRSACMS